MNIAGSTLEERVYNFHNASKSNKEWLQYSLIDFILFQKERVNRGEIVLPTIHNYYKAVKLFCDMNDILYMFSSIFLRGFLFLPIGHVTKCLILMNQQYQQKNKH